MTIFAAALIVLAVIAVGSARWSPFRDVTRDRVERFALRQSLTITPGNGPLVLRYLATTRRWRAGGMAVALLVLLGWSVVGAAFQLNVGVVFLGWFGGAVVAEWRVAAPEPGARRIASLHRRAMTDYLLSRELVALVVLGVGIAVTAVVGAAVRFGDHTVVAASLLAEFGALVLVAGGFGLVARRGLRRPQPLVEADVIAADHALRGRSLRVLAGCSLAVGGYLGAAVVATLVTSPDSAIVGVAGAVGIVFLPILGVITALAPARTVRARDRLEATV